jgi:hypothetical protein
MTKIPFKKMLVLTPRLRFPRKGTLPEVKLLNVVGKLTGVDYR